ncbi:hypothetical protein BpHYR1_029879 [Brachionus plicatilis]|uniref:Uncharacterized protein n=1 Tax=Brachionus plicatilis TaxID=10195 RepID=A0A3M7PKR9_BRAPC|nr:hypothetical protein BpHYR1_029879 [Brachionus plicatilis]
MSTILSNNNFQKIQLLNELDELNKLNHHWVIMTENPKSEKEVFYEKLQRNFFIYKLTAKHQSTSYDHCKAATIDGFPSKLYPQGCLLQCFYKSIFDNNKVVASKFLAVNLDQCGLLILREIYY